MGATYAVMDYMGLFLTVTIGIVLVVLLLSVLLGRTLAIKYRKPWAAFLPVVGFILFFALFSTYILPILEQTGDLLIPNEYEMRITAGRVENVASVEDTPRHLVNGKLCGADYVWINGECFYVISEGTLQEGMLIELEYADFENNVILCWKEATEDRVQQILQNPAIPNDTNKEETQKTVPQAIQDLGMIIRWIGMLGFVGMIVLSHVFRVKILMWFRTRDLAVMGKIMPSLGNWAISFVPLVFLTMIIAGVCLETGKYALLILFLCFCLIMILLLFSEQFTCLEIVGQRITVCKFGKEKQYQISDIHSITWKYGRGIVGKQLRILFEDGRCYWFDMDRYRGVQNVYEELTK